jgi:hypothetical protein
LASIARSGRLTRFALVSILLAIYYVMAVSAVAQKSMTFDEMAHLTAGYTYWAFNDYRLHPENGNWPQRLGALPAVAGDFTFPRLDQPAWTVSNVWVMGDQFFYSSGNDADTMLGRGRAVMALLGVALGALVYGWARRLISPAGAWVSLVLFAFSPTLLAHGPLVTSDMAAALFFTAATGALWIVLHRVTPATVFGAAAMVAGVFLSKFSGPILVPIALVMLVLRLDSGRPLVLAFRGRTVESPSRARQLAVFMAVAAVIVCVTWALIWASYGFRYTAFAAATTGKDAFLAQLKDQPGLVGLFLSTARRFHLLPEAYLYGFTNTVQFASGRVAFLNGQFSTTGWWWYFPYAFAVKTTIPAMIVGLLALAALIVRWRSGDANESWQVRAQASLYAGTPLLALVYVYWAFALSSSLNIGHRHLLPTYPALCILAGGAVYWIQPLFERRPKAEPQTGRPRRKQRADLRGQSGAAFGSVKAAGVATMLLLAWHVVESVSISPNYLAYFNELAGGPAHGYRHLADSSLDWGQDLPALRRWLDSQGLQRQGAPQVYLSYFGTARPEYYGIQAIGMAGFIDRRPPQPPGPLGAGVYCISATILDVLGSMFWRPEYERDYQAALKNTTIFARAAENEQTKAALVRQTGEDFWRSTFVKFDQMRMGRLAAFLRHREPDAMVGYTILIYRLTDADLAKALNGPAPD